MIQNKIFKPPHVPKNYSSGKSGCTPEDSPDFCMACNLQASSINLEVDFPVEPNAHIPYGIRIKCEDVLSRFDEDQNKTEFPP